MNIIFHIDVNNAFLSWSAVYLLENGYETDIRLIPSVIGGDESTRHGIVLAKSDISKKYGIKTAETIHNARSKCKNLKVFKPNYEYYQEQSNKLYNYFLKYTPDVERFSIDECFLDFTNTKYLYDDILELAHRMKNEIKEKFKFTVNIGIGNNKLCAKMASDFLKPDKVHTLFQHEIKTKMWPLSVDNLLYIGKNTSLELQKLNIKTIGDLANYDINILKKYFKNNAKFMIEYANGIDNSKVISNALKNKSISLSETLKFDTSDKDILKNKLKNMINKIGIKLRKNNLYVRTIAITIKTSDFKTNSYQKKILNQTNNTIELYNEILKLFDSCVNDVLIRNIGVRVSDLVEFKSNQLSLFENTKETIENDQIQKVIDDINIKYDSLRVMPAIFYENKKNNINKV